MLRVTNCGDVEVDILLELSSKTVRVNLFETVYSGSFFIYFNLLNSILSLERMNSRMQINYEHFL